MSDSRLIGHVEDAGAGDRGVLADLMRQLEHAQATIDEVKVGAESVAQDVERANRSLRIAEMLIERVTAEQREAMREKETLLKETRNLQAQVESARSVARLGSGLKTRLDATTEQLEAAIAERDAATALVARLEAEVAEVRRSRESTPALQVPPASTSPEHRVSDNIVGRGDEVVAPPAPPHVHTEENESPNRVHGGFLNAVRSLGRQGAKPSSTPPAETAANERAWSRDEDDALLRRYQGSRTVRETASRLGLEDREVAMRLVSLLLEPVGHIDDDAAPNFGARYTERDDDDIRQMWRDGWKLPAIARRKGRSQLGIGWRLLDDSTQPVEIYASSIHDIVEGAHA